MLEPVFIFKLYRKFFESLREDSILSNDEMLSCISKYKSIYVFIETAKYNSIIFLKM